MEDIKEAYQRKYAKSLAIVFEEVVAGPYKSMLVGLISGANLTGPHSDSGKMTDSPVWFLTPPLCKIIHANKSIVSFQMWSFLIFSDMYF